MKKMIAIAAVVAALFGALFYYLEKQEAAEYAAWHETLQTCPVVEGCEDAFVAGISQANPESRMLLVTDKQQLMKQERIGRNDPALSQFRYVLLYSPQPVSFPESSLQHLSTSVMRGDTTYYYKGASTQDNEVTDTDCEHVNDLLASLGMKKVRRANFERVRDFSYIVPGAECHYRVDEYRMKGGFYLIEIHITPQNKEEGYIGVAWKDRAGNMFVMTRDGRILTGAITDDFDGFLVNQAGDASFTKVFQLEEPIIFRDVHLSGVIRYDQMTKGGNPRVEIAVPGLDAVAIVSASLSVGGFDYKPLIDKKVDFIANAIYLPHTEVPAIIQHDGNIQGLYLTHFRLDTTPQP